MGSYGGCPFDFAYDASRLERPEPLVHASASLNTVINDRINVFQFSRRKQTTQIAHKQFSQTTTPSPGNQPAFVFLQALELCRAAGMVSLGQVALDGTKVRANASLRKAMSYGRLTEKQKVLADEVSALLADANAIDDAENARFGKDKRGDELPPELARRESRLVKLAEAGAALEADAAALARKDAEKKARDKALVSGYSCMATTYHKAK